MTIFSAKNVKGPTTVKDAYTEILKTPSTAALENMYSVVLDASTVSPDSDGVRKLVAGTLLTKNANNQYERYTGAGTGAANEVQTVVATGASAGTFTLTLPEGETFYEETTDPIAYNANAAAVKAALVALDQIDSSDVTTGGGALPGTAVTITFADSFAETDVPELVADSDGLTGGTAVVDTTTEGEVDKTIAGVLALDVEFVDGSAGSDTPAPMIHNLATFKANKIVDFGTYGAAAKAALPTCKFE